MEENEENECAYVARCVGEVGAEAEAWHDLPVAEKRRLLQECIENFSKEMDKMADTSFVVRGGDPNDMRQETSFGMCWAANILTLASWFSFLARHLSGLEKAGRQPLPLASFPCGPPGNQTVGYTVGPSDWAGSIFSGFSKIQIRTSNPWTESQDAPSPTPTTPGLVAVLGAGNYEAPIDVLTAMFLRNQACVYKTHPVNEKVSPHLKSIFAPLLHRNFLAIVHGGSSVARALVEDPGVGCWYMTGSDRTFNSIVWGHSAGPASDKITRPISSKPVVAELGGVCPLIIAPGSWWTFEVKMYAAHAAAAATFNGGHLCVRPQVLVTCRSWKKRVEFLTEFKNRISNAPAWASYYPGCHHAQREFRSILEGAHGLQGESVALEEPVSAKIFGQDRQPFLFATDIDQSSPALSHEAFCPVVVEVALDTSTEFEEFLPAAVRFANSRCSGSLSATIFAKAQSKQETAAVEDAVNSLNFGIIGLNVHPSSLILFPEAAWGAYPGEEVTAISSGVGHIGNALRIPNVSKSVIEANFLNAAVLAQGLPKSPRSVWPLKVYRRMAHAFLAKARGSLISSVWNAGKTLLAVFFGL